jgi:triacylglycerol esterase/lipase EstA (alpha/beta hydrolase family)
MSIAGWRDTDPADLSPVVLVAGGFLTMAGWYRPMAAALRARGAADVVIAPVFTPDWILSAVRGLGPVTTRVGRALLRAGEASAVHPASRGAPILYVGHSAGGIVGRLLTSPEPFEGRRLGASGRIAALVTLGTPHLVGDAARWGGRVATPGAP